MTNVEIVAEIVKRTGLPKELVSTVIADYCRDTGNVVANMYSGGFTMPNIGMIGFRYHCGVDYMERLFAKLQRRAKSELFMYARYRYIFTKDVDKFYSIANTMLENELIKNKNYRNGPGRAVPFDKAHMLSVVDGMGEFLVSVGAQLQRNEYMDIQKIHLRYLSEQGILQAPPESCDCKVQPMRVRD